MAEEIKDYTPELQKLFVETLISDTDTYSRCQSILNHTYFEQPFLDCVQFIKKYTDQYGKIPDPEKIHATCGVKLETIETPTDHVTWFLDEFEQFCRHKALTDAILTSTDLLEKNQFGAVEAIIKDAVGVGLAKNLGTDYYENPADRLTILRDRDGRTTTGWKSIDKKLYGGFNKGELNIFAGGSGAGKSLFLQNLALNWSIEKLNVVYVSLELSEGLSAMRLDSMSTAIPSKEIMKNIEDVSIKVRMDSKRNGNLQVVQLPNGVNVNDLKAYLKEYQIQRKCKVNCVIVDYLDLMMPASRKVPPSDLYVKDKLVSEELRNLAVEGDYLFVTASQLNRSAVEEIEFDHSHIGGGISKIQTADNVIGIFSSRTMRERGRVQIQFMKTRSSSGVGQKLDLEFDQQTLRIRDLADDAEQVDESESIIDKLKKKSNVEFVKEPETTPANSTDHLRSLLKKFD
jgi:archaellum biogenesis ATPase FlaH